MANNAPASTLEIRRLDAPGAAQLQALCDVLVDCVEGGASVSFMAPLPHHAARDYWRTVADDVAAGRCVLLVARLAGRIVGTVLLLPAWAPNQPHRAEIAKVLVARAGRRRGLATRLMAAAEREALARGRTLLTLDTVEGGDAERLYTQLGWQRVGAIPGYALMPDGAPCATVVFYKHLTRR